MILSAYLGYIFFSFTTIPVGIAVVAAAPADHSELTRLSGFDHQADPEEVGLLAESESGFVHSAESMWESKNNRGTWSADTSEQDIMPYLEQNQITDKFKSATLLFLLSTFQIYWASE